MEEKLKLPLVAFKKNTSWACANIIRLRVPTVSGDMSTVGSRFKADKTVSLICKKAPLANYREEKKNFFEIYRNPAKT